MKFSFGDLFLGIIHFFVIFVPGGVLLVLLTYFAATFGLLSLPKTFLTEHWLALFAGGFFLGHIVSYLGAKLEDENNYLKDDVSQEMRSLVSEIVESMLPANLVEKGNLRRWTQTILRNTAEFEYSEIEKKDADRRFLRNIRIVLPVALFVLLVTLLKTLFELYFRELNEQQQLLVFTLISIAVFLLSLLLIINPKALGWERLFTKRKDKAPSYLPIECHENFKEFDLFKNLIKKVTIFLSFYAGIIVLNFAFKKSEIFILYPVLNSKNLHIQLFSLIILYLCRDFVEARYFDQDKKFTRIIFESFIAVYYDKFKYSIQLRL